MSRGKSITETDLRLIFGFLHDHITVKGQMIKDAARAIASDTGYHEVTIKRKYTKFRDLEPYKTILKTGDCDAGTTGETPTQHISKDKQPTTTSPAKALEIFDSYHISEPKAYVDSPKKRFNQGLSQLMIAIESMREVYDSLDTEGEENKALKDENRMLADKLASLKATNNDLMDEIDRLKHVEDDYNKLVEIFKTIKDITQIDLLGGKSSQEDSSPLPFKRFMMESNGNLNLVETK